jgi:hypothetical protein
MNDQKKNKSKRDNGKTKQASYVKPTITKHGNVKINLNMTIATTA